MPSGISGRNVFIGTIHGFVNRFIVSPFAGPLQLLPDQRLFAELDVHKMVEAMTSSQLSHAARNKIKTHVVNGLLRRGVVPYDELINIARKIMSERSIRDTVSRRIQSLFIDELQDTDNRQLEIFDGLRKAGATKIYAVGDPEQFIYSFTYGGRGLKHPSFESISFFKFRDQAVPERNVVNRRSCTEIVTFLNQFHTELEQTSAIGPRHEPRVVFIKATSKKAIVTAFRVRTDGLPQKPRVIHRLYLGYENSLYDDVSKEFGIRHISNGSRHRESLLQEALDLLALCVGASQNRCCELLALTLHEWRKNGVTVLHQVREEWCGMWIPLSRYGCPN